MHTNRLVDATSPYLLQHAHNPVNWYPWGEEALARARAEEKPIFLSIGYSACHWCHVMEKESFETDAIARLMNENFVSIKVDREERPDLDDLYMMAVQLSTGSGGWPMSVFLTPDLKPFYCGTYFPPTDRYGRPGFATVLTQLALQWRERRANVEEVAERTAAAVRDYSTLQAEEGQLGPELIFRAIDGLIERFDGTHGGFGGAPKFPPSMALELILRELARLPAGGRADRLRQVVTLTLDRMAQGGLYDQIGGGFHRYSTDHRWLVPHFEKMLYDNALLVPVYLEAHRLTGDAYYARVARETLDFTLREMTHPEGGFYSTLDADSEGEEGKYYVWTPDEVTRVLGAQDGSLFCQVYDITPGGNFEGQNIPHLEKSIAEWAQDGGQKPEELQARLDGMRARLLEARSQRVRPGLDDKILTSWNGLMIRAMARAATALGEARYREAAERAATFVLTHLQRDGRLLRSWRDGRALLDGFHDDYAFFIVGLLDLHEATADARWLQEAERLTATMNELFWDEAGGAYFFTPHDGETLIARLKSPEDNAIPSGNSMAALALVRLAGMRDDRRPRTEDRGPTTNDQRPTTNDQRPTSQAPGPRERAERLLGSHAAVMGRMPGAFPQMLVAADLYLEAFDGGRLGRPSEGVVQARVLVGGEAPAPGEVFPAAVWLRVAMGWHVNANTPRQSYLIPTEVDLAPEPGFTLVRTLYPEGHLVKLGFSEEELLVYEGETLIGLEIAVGAPTKVAPGVAPGDYRLRLRLRYQPCSETECLAPVEEWFDVPLRTTGG